MNGKLIEKLTQKVNAYKFEYQVFEFNDISKFALEILDENEDIVFIQTIASDDKGNIDVKKVAESKNIRLEYIPMESSISGYLRQENGEWIIGVNSIHNPKRQRFTIAHELGHFYMHKDKNVDFECFLARNFEDTTFFRNTDNSSIEYSANEFAANLLMPEDSIRKAIQTGTKNIEDLSSQFNVSIAAIKYRVLSLGYKLKS